MATKRDTYKAFLLDAYRKNTSLKGCELNKLAKEEFGVAVEGTLLKEVRLEINPNYPLQRHRKPKLVATGGITCQDKVGIAKLYKSAEKYGVAANVVRAMVLEASGKIAYIPDFTKEQVEQAKKNLLASGVACFKLSRGGEIYLVKSHRVTIMDNRSGRGMRFKKV
jgi:hypothetical protein